MSDGMSEQGDVVFSGEHLRATMFNGEASRLLTTFSFREAGRKDFNLAQMSYSAQKHSFASPRGATIGSLTTTHTRLKTL